ncbi:MAG: hypothetical protein K1X51_17525 [Rhodospirillaceae bacterium]|nr:hypothetical protein [Rhodospirillaceae bacterium]
MTDLRPEFPSIESHIAKFFRRHGRRVLIGVTLIAGALAGAPAQAWETAHGPTDNTGLVDIVTKPAEFAARTVSDIGTIAPGAGPVVAPDGTVYLANQQGKLMSFKPDGTPGWSRNITAGQQIVASPAVGSDGSVYVIGVSVSRDHRGGKTVKRVDAWLHVFNSTGGYLGSTQFPDHDGAGGTTASPNLWRFIGTELVLVPAVYGTDVRLLGFSTGGGLVLDQHAVNVSPDIFGGWDPFSEFPASDGQNGRDNQPPSFQPVGVFINPQGGTPFILVSNGNHSVVGFTLSAGALIESFRIDDDNRFMRSAPAILPDKHGIIGTEDAEQTSTSGPHGTNTGGVVFTGPNLNKLAPVAGLGAINATPTHLSDGRTALISTRQLAVIDGRIVVKRLPLLGYSFASAAASRTHIFVSTTDAIQTFDTATLTEVSRMLWSGGGTSQPAISPLGYVYAVADDGLFVFPPAKQLPPNRVTPLTGTTVVSTDPGASTQDSKPYVPPLLPSGNRLFACEKLDGDDCGKGDYNAIATAFCQKEGFIGAGQIKVDTKKVKAETLDGRFCSKKKCKVFEQIICANN